MPTLLPTSTIKTMKPGSASLKQTRLNNVEETKNPAEKKVTIVVPSKAERQSREMRKLEKPSGKSPRATKAVTPRKDKTKSKIVPISQRQTKAKTKTTFGVHKNNLAKSAADVGGSSGRFTRADILNRRPSELNPLKKEHDDLTRKMEELVAIIKKLKKSEFELKKENEAIRNEQYLRELEVEKLVQYWTLSRQQLESEQERGIFLETRIQRMRTAHIEQVSLLHKRISMLQLKAEVRRISATQTDPFGADSDATHLHSIGAQTSEAWNAQRAHDAMRSNDEQLAELIAEIEHQRLQAQTDFKFAVVQVEQKLREQHDSELRSVKEDRERQVEDISRIQNDRILIGEQEKAHLKKEFTEQIIDQKVQITRLTDRLNSAEAEIRSLGLEAIQKEKSFKKMSTECDALNRKIRLNQVELKDAKKVAQVARQLRIRLEKIEEINEILLGEFQKVEQERNRYAEQLHPSYSTNSVSQIDQKRNSAYEFGQRLDSIRREHGGIHLSYKI